MALSLTQTATVRITAGQAITNNLLRLLALSPSVSISGSVGTADLAAGAVTAAKSTPGAYWFGTTTGGTTAYVLTLNPALGALADGVQIWFKVNATNTNPATLNVNGLGAVNFKRNGADIVQGDLLINRIYSAVYNSTGPSWDLVGRLGNPDQRYETAGGTANALTFTSTGSDAVNSLSALRGRLLAVRITSNNTGPATLAVDGLAAKDIKLAGNKALGGGELIAGDIAWFSYTSVNDTFQLMNPAAGDTPVTVASVRNLLAFNNTATPNSKVDLTADEVVVRATSGQAKVLSTVSLTVDITASGANGLDTGAEAGSTWYYLWVIWNGTTTAGLLSASSTAPTMPSGYTHKALVGAVRNDGSSNFVALRQHDRRVWTTEQVVLAAKAPAVNDTWEILAGADLTALRAAVPPIARSISGIMGADNTTDNVSLMLAAVAEDGTLASVIAGSLLLNISNVGTAYNSFGVAGPFTDLPVRGGASYNIQWKSRLTTLTVSLSTTSYTF